MAELKGAPPTTRLTARKKQKVLELLEINPHIGEVAEMVGTTTTTLWHHRKAYPEFAEAFEKARERGMDSLEDALIFRGRSQSDTAAIFMLKSWRRQKYMERIKIDIDVRHLAVVIAGKMGLDFDELVAQAEEIAALADTEASTLLDKTGSLLSGRGAPAEEGTGRSEDGAHIIEGAWS